MLRRRTRNARARNGFFPFKGRIGIGRSLAQLVHEHRARRHDAEVKSENTKAVDKNPAHGNYG